MIACIKRMRTASDQPTTQLMQFLRSQIYTLKCVTKLRRSFFYFTQSSSLIWWEPNGGNIFYFMYFHTFDTIHGLAALFKGPWFIMIPLTRVPKVEMNKLRAKLLLRSSPFFVNAMRSVKFFFFCFLFCRIMMFSKDG